MKYKILFLDLNGTLIDDWEASFAGVVAIFREHNKNIPRIEEYIEAVALTGDYKQFYVTHGIEVERDDLYRTFIPAYHRHLDGEICLMPGVVEGLKLAREKSTEIHIITAGRKEGFAEHLLFRTGIQEYCDSFHFHVHNKEAQIRAIIDSMEVEPKECIMVGDLPSDILHARRANVRGVVFLNRHVPRDLFRDVPMDFAITDLRGLVDFLE